MKKQRDPFSLAPQWPPNLPHQCSRCGNDYDIRSALDVGPCRAGRRIRKIAPWLTFAMLALMFTTRLSFLDLGGRGAPMAFVAMLVIPSVLLWILGGLLPTKARLYCFKCDHSEYHSLPSSKSD